MLRTLSLFCCSVLIFPSIVNGDEIFFTGGFWNGGIWRVNLDGSGLQQIVERTVEFGIPTIAFNGVDQKIYWSEHYGGIWRSSRDGSDIEPVMGSEWLDPEPFAIYDSDAHSIVFDEHFMYWGAGAEALRVGRLSLVDETGVETIIESGNGWVDALVVDSNAGLVYWIEGPNCSPGCAGALMRADLDGNNKSVLMEPVNPHDMAIDGKGFLYWSDGGLYKSELDGSDAVQIIEDVSSFALDSHSDSIIFSRENTLMRANMSGEDVQEILTLDFGVTRLAVRMSLEGDFNDNGVLDAGDIDMLAGEPSDPSLDVTGDGVVTQKDREYWVHDLANTYFGDANLNGEFNSSDIVQVFEEGKYETGDDAGWAEGDWNGDGIFDSSDLVTAFEDGGYELGPRTEAAAVPEPYGWTLFLTNLLAWLLVGRSRRPV